MMILLGSLLVVGCGLILFVARALPNIMANLHDLQHYQYLE
ncbi:hypothetical protein [Rhizobium deserti]|nr:hypothetical protein [Rhizobium deserti]